MKQLRIPEVEEARDRLIESIERELAGREHQIEVGKTEARALRRELKVLRKVRGWAERRAADVGDQSK